MGIYTYYGQVAIFLFYLFLLIKGVILCLSINFTFIQLVKPEGLIKICYGGIKRQNETIN